MTRSIADLALVLLLLVGVFVGASESSQIDSKFENATYAYTKDIGGVKGVEVVKVHFKNAFSYESNAGFATIDSFSQISDSNPYRVINSSLMETRISIGEPLKLEEGYELLIEDIKTDREKESMFVELTKNGIIVDSAAVTIPKADKGIKADEGIFVYIKDDIEVINISVKNVFRGADTALATVNSIWQVSENDPSHVINNSSKDIIISTSKPLELAEGYQLAIKTIDVNGNKVWFWLTNYGEVVDSAVISPHNAENGTFIFSDDIGRAKNLKLIDIHFKNAFRGANTDLATIDRIWQASETNLSNVINNSSKNIIIFPKNPLKLNEGYELSVESIDVGGNKVYVELSKKGLKVDSAVIIPPKVDNETFIYRENAGGAKNLEVIDIHFKNVFRGADAILATVDSIWQVSENDPSHVINNSSKDIIISPDNPLRLEESYELTVKNVDVDGNKVYVELNKNGQAVNSAVISPPVIENGTFIYCKDIGLAKNLFVY